MASYYHDARAHAKKLKELSEDNKRRAERKAEIAETQVEHPLNYLFVEGRSCKIFRNSEQHQNLENGIGLIPWGNGGTLIDRFDGRALLDFYKEPDASAWTRPKTPQEEKLDQSLRFESFRDVVRLTTKGLSEPEGLAFARQENIEIRAAMRAAATAAAAAAAGQRNPPPLSAAMPAAGTGAFAAVGFNYGGSGAGGGGGDSSSSDSDSSDSEDDSEEEAGGDDADAGQEAEDDRIDDIAEQFGLTDFSYRLHRAQQQEGEEEARLRKPPRRRVSRKNARERARRMAGMGLDPKGAPMGTARDWTQPPPPRSAAQDNNNIRILPPRPSRDSLDEDGHRRRRSRSRSSSRSRSRSPGRYRYGASGRAQYITEFSSAAAAPGGSRAGGGGGGGSRAGGSGNGEPGGVAAALVQQQQQQQLAANRPTIDRSMFEREEGILEALPDQPDPAALGAQPIPVPPTSVQAIRAAAEGSRRDGRSAGGGGGRRERERDERERERNYHGYSYRRRYEQDRRSSRSRSRSRSRERDRDRDRERERDSRDRPAGGGGGGGAGGSGEADRVRDRQRSGSGASTSGYGAAKGTTPAAGRPAAAAAAVGGSTSTGGPSAGGGGGAKETPQERLKRIMAAQLNKQAQKDHLQAAQRKLQVEKEKEARNALERVVMRRSPSPPPRDRDRDRDRERSERERSDYDSAQRRGRSRSRSRSPRGGGHSSRRRSRSR